MQNIPFLWGWEGGNWNLHFYLLAHVQRNSERTHTKWFLSHIAGGGSIIHRSLENNLPSSSNGEDEHIPNSAIPIDGPHPGETRTPRPGDMRENTHWTRSKIARVCKQTAEWRKLAERHVQAGAIYAESLNMKNNIAPRLWVCTCVSKSDFTFTFYFHALEKEMATHSSVLA